MEKTEKFIRCKRCNRILKTEEAQARGYGKCCYKHHLQDNKKEQPNLFTMNSIKMGDVK